MGKDMSDEQAADFYADPANQGFDDRRVIRPRTLGDSIPVRFPTDVLEQVRVVAAAEGITVSQWVRQAVEDALAERGKAQGGAAAIARELERLARRLRRSA